MQSKSKFGNEYLISTQNGDFLSFVHDNMNFKLIKYNNICGSEKSDFIEFTDEEIQKNGFLETLEKNLNTSNTKEIYFRLMPIVLNKQKREETIYFLKNKKYKVFELKSLFINLKNSYNFLKKNLRKSYKSLINKEKKSNSIIFSVDKNFKSENFQDWIKLYRSVLFRGNKNLNNISIEIMKKAVKENQLIISLAYQNNILLGGVTFNVNSFYVSYSSAANSRFIEKDKSRYIGHYLLWESIIKLKELNFKYLDLGSEVAMDNVKEKEKNVVKFKKGFGPSELTTYHFSKKV